MIPADGPAVTVERAAEIMHCSVRQIFNLLADGTIREAKSFGRKTLVVTQSIYEAMEIEPVAIIAVKPKGRRQTAELMAAKLRAGRAGRRADLRAARDLPDAPTE